MKIHILPAVVLLLIPMLGFAADPMTPTPMPSGAAAAAAPAEPTTSPSVKSGAKGLSLAISEMNAAFVKTEECFALEASLKADLAKKKAELSAEFNGKIPLSFNDLLWQKTTRINKQHAACFQQYEALGKMFEALENAFRTIEPKNLNVKKQKEAVDAQKARYLQMVPTAKQYNRPPKTKPAAAAAPAEE